MIVTAHDPRYFTPPPKPPRSQGLESSTFEPPTLDGSVPFPELCDWQYHHSPDHPFFIFDDPSSSEPDDIRVYRWKTVVPAIHRTGRHILSLFNLALPLNPESPPVIAILSAADTFTYLTVNLSVLRTGATLFPISHRNSAPAIAHLLRATGVTAILVGREPSLNKLASAAIDIIRNLGGTPPSAAQMPSFDEIYTDSATPIDAEEFLPRLGWRQKDRAGLIVHSSGSTEWPKPIYWSYHGLTLMAAFPYYGEQDFCGLRCSFHCVPMFHGLGMIAALWSMSCGMVITSFRPQTPPVPLIPSTILEGFSKTGSDAAFAIPALIEAWSQSPQSVKELKRLKALYYGGGPLAKSVGDYLSAEKVQVMCLYASSEISVVSSIPKRAYADWEYFTFAPYIQPHLIPSGNGVYELVVTHNPKHLPAVINTHVGGEPAYASNDLLVPHPTLEGYWKFFGRTDDQIVHSTGEKTNPSPLEAIMVKDPRIRSAVMFGQGKFNAGVIIDPIPEFQFDCCDRRKFAEFRNLIWDSVSKANECAPQHSRIFKEMILVSKKDKPFVYSSKGTPRRKAVTTSYEAEIEDLYQTVEDTAINGFSSPATWSLEASRAYIRTIVLGVMMTTLRNDDDFFAHGCDSLQATWIRKIIINGLRSCTRVNTRDLSTVFVYEHPTINELGEFVANLVSPREMAQTIRSEVEQMLALVGKYSFDFPEHTPSTVLSEKRCDGDVILITGTTGSIGASTLAELLASPKVEKVYALNRAHRRGSPLITRQKLALTSQGLDGDIVFSEKLVMLEGDLGRPCLGLEESIQKRMRDSLTHIMHIAWRVDFNMTLLSFETDIADLRRLIDFALSCRLHEPPRFLFVSSVAVVSRSENPLPVPEHAVPATSAVGTGYGESKWVAETLLSEARARTPLDVVIVRSGQVSGGINGYWNTSDWFPSMIQSASTVKCLPVTSTEKTVSFVPLDVAAKAIADMRDSPTPILHLAHPSPVSWNSVIQPTADMLSVPLVYYNDWVSRLELIDDDDDLGESPSALRLLGFFRRSNLDGSAERTSVSPEVMGFPRLSMKRTIEYLPRLGEMRGIVGEVGKWLKYWNMR